MFRPGQKTSLSRRKDFRRFKLVMETANKFLVAEPDNQIFWFKLILAGPIFYDGAKTTKQETTLLRKLISCQLLFRFQPKMSEPRKMNEPNFDEIGNFFRQVCKNHGNSFNWLRFIDNFGPTVQGSVRSGSISWIHLLARSGSGHQIHLPVSLYKPCAMYICMLVSSCHPKTNKLLDTSLRLLPYLTY